MATNPQDREAVLRGLIEKMGGKLLGFYYCFGEYDGIIISEHTDETTALAACIAAIAPGHIKAVRTTVLFTMQDTMEAARKAGAVVYQAPKG